MSEAKTLRDLYQQVIDSTQELLEVRAQAKGRPVVNAEAYARSLEQIAHMRPFSKMHTLTGEKRACAVFDWQFVNGLLPEDIVRPEVECQMKREHRFASGKCVDRSIVHTDGRLTLIELKDSVDERSIVAGIGQVLWYAAMAEVDYSFAPIDPVLAVLGEPDQYVSRACERAGVHYFPMGSIEHFKFLSLACEIAVNNGRTEKG